TVALACLALVLATGVVELGMGRLLFGPDGRFGWIALDVWSSENSQRVIDPYSLSHVLHGVLFYALLHLVAPRASLGTRLVAAVALEAGWEVLENSPLVINRYREVTMALGYEGDSVINSVSDVVMMAIGFGLAAWLPVRGSVALVLVSELVMLVAIRDNLTLNIVMLVYPLDAIRRWQMAGRD
ncbi:MAG: DUF2585 family protein, partial [Vicinamibacterales bacterium]